MKIGWIARWGGGNIPDSVISLIVSNDSDTSASDAIASSKTSSPNDQWPELSRLSLLAIIKLGINSMRFLSMIGRRLPLKEETNLKFPMRWAFCGALDQGKIGINIQATGGGHPSQKGIKNTDRWNIESTIPEKNGLPPPLQNRQNLKC